MGDVFLRIEDIHTPGDRVLDIDKYRISIGKIREASAAERLL